MFYYIHNNRDENESLGFIFAGKTNLLRQSKLKRLDISENFLNELKNQSIKMYFNPQRGNIPADLLLNILGWPLVSEKVKSIFLDNVFVKGVYFVPIEVYSFDKACKYKYYLIYTTNFIDGIDLNKSKIINYSPEYDLYCFAPNQIVLNHDVCENYLVFRCNYYKSRIYFDEIIVKTLNENNCTGFHFVQENL